MYTIELPDDDALIKAHYIGYSCVATIGGALLPHKVRHSPDGFGYGYGGSGPADLALSILWAVTQDEEVTNQYYEQFKREFVALYPKDKPMEIPVGVVRAWLRQKRSLALAEMGG